MHTDSTFQFHCYHQKCVRKDESNNTCIEKNGKKRDHFSCDEHIARTGKKRTRIMHKREKQKKSEGIRLIVDVVVRTVLLVIFMIARMSKRYQRLC